MKSIYYCSNTQSDIFPQNTRSKFESYIDINDLSYLPPTNIEAAIKSIIFDNKRSEYLPTEEVLALRSNIGETTIRSSEYDNVLSILNVNGLQKDIVHIQFDNPTFFSTRKELLSQASFQLICVNSNNLPNFIHGSPTYIQVVVRETEGRMKRPFNIFLDSDDVKSKEMYPNNTNMNFTIDLPERMSFNRRWNVTLKSLIIPNTLYNICDDLFYIKYIQFGKGSLNTTLQIKNGCYRNISLLIREIQSIFDSNKIPLKIKDYGGRIIIMYKYWRKKMSERQLYLSPYLAFMLGYNGKLEMGQFLNFSVLKEYLAPHEFNIHLLTPRSLIVCCDIVDDTIFGAQHVKLLRLVTNNINPNLDILSFDFFQNEYVDLNVKEFKNISIRIADVTGNTVKSETTIPTRMQLVFTNI